jgi:hypothetical protein
LPPAVALADGGNDFYEFKQSFAADVTEAVAKPMDPRDRIRGEVGPRLARRKSLSSFAYSSARVPSRVASPTK